MNFVLTKSHYVASTVEPCLEGNLHQIIENTCNANPNKTAFVFYPTNERITFGKLKIQIDKTAKYFIKLGLSKGDKILIIDHSNIHFISTALAAMGFGLVFNSVNPLASPKEIINVLLERECQAVICSRECYAKLIEVYPEIIQQTEINKLLPNLRHVIVNGHGQSDLCQPHFIEDNTECTDDNSVLENIKKRIQPDDICLIHATSGSTGQSKLVSCTYRQMLNNAFFYGKRVAYYCQDFILCIPSQVWRVGLFISTVIVSVIYGTKLVIIPMISKADIGSILNIIENEKCSILKAQPKMLNALITHPDFSYKKLSTLKSVITGGDTDNISQEFIENIISTLRLKDFLFLVIMSEANVILMTTSPSDLYSLRGYILPHHEIKIVNSRGETVPIGYFGEIYVKGLTVIKSYCSNSINNEHYFTSDGWLKTKDLGIMHKNGSVSFIGRSEDFIIQKKNIFSLKSAADELKINENIEEIKMIQISTDINNIDPVVIAFIVIKKDQKMDENTFKEMWPETQFPFFPKHFIFMDFIPRIYADKVDRQKLKEIATNFIENKNLIK